VAWIVKVFSQGRVYGEVVLIFLTVGTWRIGYDRLVKAIDELVDSGVINEEVVAQIGYSSYEPKHMTVMRFCSPDEFAEMISKARIVISHAGMGTIIEAVKQTKPIIVLPRKSKLGEVDNDHQFTTAKQLQTEGKLLAAYDVSELPEKLKQAENFTPKQEHGCEEIVRTVQEFIDSVVAKKSAKPNGIKELVVKLWPYRILKRDDNGIKADLNSIMQHFATQGEAFDTIVFVPYCGKYMSELFVEIFDGSFKLNFVTVRRASTVLRDGFFKKFVFERKWLSNPMRHLDVLLRLIKYKLRLNQKMVVEPTVDFDVRDKKVLVIDDDVATGTTMELVKSTLLKHGASSVTTASISNHFLPDKIEVDYSVYRYKLLRTRNSRDYYAT
jgi:UDP-N-acetylglucosamine transferase subunit ALG13